MTIADNFGRFPLPNIKLHRKTIQKTIQKIFREIFISIFYGYRGSAANLWYVCKQFI
jgi:hypothetical protein